MLPQLLAATLGFSIAFGLMPWVMELARRHELLDQPDFNRRIHTVAVPRLGGVAIFIATIIAVAVIMGWDYLDSSFALPPRSSSLPGMIIGATIVFFVGIVDDLRGVRPSLKIVAQSAAALAMVAYGFRIDAITIGGSTTLHLGALAVPLTVLWVVGMTNAFNLIDGVDGLAGTMGLIGLACCIGVDFLIHENSSLVVAFAMTGAVFAFLRYNRPPARIFLGDSGSMLLGFFLSIRIVFASTTESGVTYALIPLFALAYPLTDTFISIARRWLRGHPFSRADGRHIHHQILALGLSPKRTVELLGLFFFSVACMGLSIVFAPPRVTLALAMGGAVLVFAVFFYGAKWLRYSEFTELGASVASVMLNARRHVRTKVMAGEMAERLLQAESVDELRTMLADSAGEFNLVEVSLLPGANHFAGPKSRQISPLAERPFRVDYPIAWEHDGKIQEVVLRLWAERPTNRQHCGAERIASRLGGALETWLQQHPAAFAPVPATERTSDRVSARGGLRAIYQPD